MSVVLLLLSLVLWLLLLPALDSSGLILATAATGTFTYTRFHIPRAPTAPAMAPAARARPGGLGVRGSSWLAQSSPDPAIPVCKRRRKLPLGELPRPGCMGWVVYEEYKLVPCSSRPAGVVTRCN